MKPQDFRFTHRLRVRWAEVDMQKIVFNAHYLMYFDTAIADYWRALALPYEEAMQLLAGDLYVKKASIEYHQSALFDDQLAVALKCQRIGTSSITFAGAVFRGKECLVTSELVYVFADPATQTSRPVPAAFRDLLNAFEAGESVLHLQVGSWPELHASATALRTEIFVQEQAIPADLVVDDADPQACHVVAFNRLGQPVATGRLLKDVNGVVRIGRMAVKKVLRGEHLGSEVLATLLQAAKSQGALKVVVHAQGSAEGFYRRRGFTLAGEAFEAAGISHICMQKSL